MVAVVQKSLGKYFSVKKNDGEIVTATLAGKLRNLDADSTSPIVIGDKVEIINQNDDWSIVQLFERKNFIARKSVKLSKRRHIIAANVDQCLLIVTIKSPKTSTSFIDRFLVACEHNNVPVSIIFNKTDLLNNSLFNYYKKIGYDCLKTSFAQNKLESIKKLIKGKFSLISGHSGVGKSTLINKLNSNFNIRVSEISDYHEQGKHTTTFSEIYELDNETSLIDTPGIRGFGLVKIDSKDIRRYFPEFAQNQHKCKYSNCVHINEPKCEIKKLISSGLIISSRYDNYCSMFRSEDIYR
jgi:ribosome biogenesis GTPase